MSDLRLRSWRQTRDFGDFDPDATAKDGPAAVSEHGAASGSREESGGFAERFVHLGEIGRGGMGSVHQAADRKLLREVAVKMLEAEGEDLSAPAARFRQEAQITSQLDHPNILPIHDLGVDADGVPFLLMKLVRGDSLATILSQAGSSRLLPAKLEELLRILIKVCEALSFAHSRGVAHCDVKPANIMVGPFGEVYLMDWGIARLLRSGDERPGTERTSSKSGRTSPSAPSGLSDLSTAGDPATPEPGEQDRAASIQASPSRVRTEGPYLEREGRLLGTPNYLAPEQVRSHRPLDERTDVFLLGATLYHILADRPPYVGKSTLALLKKAAFAEFPSPESVAGDAVPAPLSRIVRRAMAANPEDRYASARELQDELEQFLRGSWHLPVETFAPGEIIVREGEAGDTAYILVDGHCEVFIGAGDGRTVLREMGPGQVFGETAVVSDKPRTASVEALDSVTVMTVTREALTEGLGLNSWIGSFVVELAERFREVDARLRELQHHQPPTPDREQP